MASGWNLWVWLQSVGRVGVVVRRYINILIIIINFPYSTCSRSFLAATSLLLCSFLNDFSVFIYIYIYIYQKNSAVMRIYVVLEI